MRISCAECGCVVERATIVESCPAYPECCCAHLYRGTGEATRG